MDVLYPGRRKDLWEINFRYTHNKFSTDGAGVSGNLFSYSHLTLLIEQPGL